MDSEFTLSLVSGLHAARALRQDMQQDVRELLTTFCMLAMAIGGFVGMLSLRSVGEMGKVSARSLVCLMLFDSYDSWFVSAVEAADALAAGLRERSEYLASVAHVVNSITAFVEAHDDSAWDIFVGLAKGATLSWTNLIASWTVITALDFVTLLTFVALNVLYVLGPLMIAGGIFADGLTLRAWGSSLFKVLLWPIFPCFVLVVNEYLSQDYQLAYDNLSAALSTNVVLTLMVLLTPIAVSMLMSHGGVAALGAMAWGAGLSLTAKAFAAGIGGMDGLLAGGATGGGSSLTPAMAPSDSSSSVSRDWFQGDKFTLFQPPNGAAPASLPPPSPYLGPDDNGACAWVRNPQPPTEAVPKPTQAHPGPNETAAPQVINAAGVRAYVPGYCQRPNLPTSETAKRTA